MSYQRLPSTICEFRASGNQVRSIHLYSSESGLRWTRLEPAGKSLKFDRKLWLEKFRRVEIFSQRLYVCTFFLIFSQRLYICTFLSRTSSLVAFLEVALLVALLRDIRERESSGFRSLATYLKSTQAPLFAV